MRPFAETLTLIITIPKSAVEDATQTLVPIRNLRFNHRIVGILTALPCFHGFFVTTDYGGYIFCPAGTTFDLKYPHTGIQHLIQEMNGLQILGRHDILIIDIEFHIGGLVLDRITATANLHAGSPVGTQTVVIEAQVTFAAYSHA